VVEEVVDASEFEMVDFILVGDVSICFLLSVSMFSFSLIEQFLQIKVFAVAVCTFRRCCFFVFIFKPWVVIHLYVALQFFSCVQIIDIDGIGLFFSV
jgi:hypothetical protein